MKEIVVKDSFLLTEEELQIVEDMASCNYAPNQIALYLEIKAVQAFSKLCLDGESEVWRRYQRGVLVSEFEINQKLGENARAGNITAAQQFNKNQEKVVISNLINKYFG